MRVTREQSELDIQAVLRAEIKELQFRHEVEIALIHATYAMALNGPAEGLPTIEQQVALILQSPLFDAQWYLNTNRDVAESAMDAAGHYIVAGAFEGRNPGPAFDSKAYYLANPDVADAGWPALVHYIQFGKTEGRELD